MPTETHTITVARVGDIDKLRDFLHALEEHVLDDTNAHALSKLVAENYGALKPDFERLLLGYETLFDNFCDPTKSHLASRPDAADEGTTSPVDQFTQVNWALDTLSQYQHVGELKAALEILREFSTSTISFEASIQAGIQQGIAHAVERYFVWQIDKLNVHPGDTLVIRFPAGHRPTAEENERFRKMLSPIKERLGIANIIIFRDDPELSVIPAGSPIPTNNN